MDKVVVTGANGHVGSTLVRLLAETGYRVRATVRDARDAAKTAPLREVGVQIVEADLLRPETLAPALEGCDGLFQVAAVYRTWSRDPQREIVAPSVAGGMNVLRAARQVGIKKVVYTSSVAAVGSDAPADRPLTEEDWNDSAVSPYFAAKTRAERQAWEFARENGMKMVAINPAAVIGPGFYRHTPSTLTFEMILRRRMPFALPTGYAFVDVRDVARAHVLAYERADACGRYLVSTCYFEMVELMKFLNELDPGIRAPTRVLPLWLLPAVPALDWLLHALTGAPRQISRATARELGGRHQRVSAARIQRELGWQPMDFTQTVRETLEWIRKVFLKKA